MNKFHEVLTDQLSRESSFINDNGDLKKFIIIDAAYNINPRLIELLIEIDEIKNKFFTEIKKHWVFNINLFVQYMENKNFLKDSYTRYKNKIGLNIDGKFMNQRNEVSLVWPFKDCVLEGGQTKEDQKRPEIFFNELLAQEEIDQLFEPKVLTNWKRYTTDGEEKVTKLKRNNKGIIKENLIIKGNNLLVLHSLLPRFEEKVKLIYIDPPYNTGNDSFGYNDNFNHSTWLTFMKNRLETAKKLLRKDGVIFVQIDESEQASLKLLLDEIFKKQNYISNIHWQRSPDRPVLGQIGVFIFNIVENIYCYAKNKTLLNVNNVSKTRIADDKYLQPYSYLLIDFGKKEFVKSITSKSGIEIQIYKHNNFEIDRIDKKDRKKLVINNHSIVFRLDHSQPEYTLQTMILKEIEKEGLFSVEYIPSKGKNVGKNIITYYWKKWILGFIKDRTEVVNDKIQINSPISNLWLDSDIGVSGIYNEGKVKLKRGKKPEKLIQRIIEMATQKNDIVLDYHLGSGTTSAVAHKMGRQYIGIEQLDYGKNDSVIRMQNVIGKKIKKDGEWIDTIECDKSGISKAVNWQGGGDFVYCELKKYNQTFIEQIEEAKDSKELLKIWEEMKKHSFINYNVDIKKQDEAIEEFKELTIKQQKEILLEILNKNQLYVNLSSIDDEDFKVSDEDKKLTKDFYKIEQEQKATQMKTGL